MNLEDVDMESIKVAGAVTAQAYITDNGMTNDEILDIEEGEISQHMADTGLALHEYAEKVFIEGYRETVRSEAERRMNGSAKARKGR